MGCRAGRGTWGGPTEESTFAWGRVPACTAGVFKPQAERPGPGTRQRPALPPGPAPEPAWRLTLEPPVWLHRLTPHYIYPQAIVQPSVVIPATPVPSLSSPYVEYTPASPAYAQYPPAAYDQYPYAASPASPASFLSYSYPAAVPPGLTAPAGTAFVQYQAPQLQPDRMQ